MKHVQPEDHWPESWKVSYRYDRLEIYGEETDRGYCYAYHNRRKATLELLGSLLPAGAQVLDIAAAQGNFSLALAELGYEVTWNDLRAELAGYVRLKHERGLIHFAAGNAFELSFPKPFDAVLITEVIEHVAHPDAFLRSVAALVRPGGYIVMTTPNGGYFRNRLPRFSDCADPSVYESIQFQPDSDGHIFLLHTDEVCAFAEQSGLVIEELRLFTNSLTHGHIKLRLALRALPRGLVEKIESVSQKAPVWLARRLFASMGVRFRKPVGIS